MQVLVSFELLPLNPTIPQKPDLPKPPLLNLDAVSQLGARIAGSGKEQPSKLASAVAQTAGRAAALEEALTTVLGSKWKKVGHSPPYRGKEISNEPLKAALSERQEFTKTELNLFGVKDLEVDSFIKVGDVYFEQAGTAPSEADLALALANDPDAWPKPSITAPLQLLDAGERPLDNAPELRPSREPLPEQLDRLGIQPHGQPARLHLLVMGLRGLTINGVLPAVRGVLQGANPTAKSANPYIEMDVGAFQRPIAKAVPRTQPSNLPSAQNPNFFPHSHLVIGLALADDEIFTPKVNIKVITPALPRWMLIV